LAAKAKIYSDLLNWSMNQFVLKCVEEMCTLIENEDRAEVPQMVVSAHALRGQKKYFWVVEPTLRAAEDTPEFRKRKGA
jgi:hypothetical protein